MASSPRASRPSTRNRSGPADTAALLPRFATPHLVCPVPSTSAACCSRATTAKKQGWSTDYPGADINFSVRLAELTKVQVKMRGEDDGEGGDTPDAVVVRLTDEALFKCPFTFMEDAGTARFNAIEG